MSIVPIFNFHGVKPIPDAYCNMTFSEKWIRPFPGLLRAFQMNQNLYTTQWDDTKSPECTIIPHLADICFNIHKFILKQAKNLYKLKCPQGVGLGLSERLNLGAVYR